MADARASKARDRKIVWVRLPPPVHLNYAKGKIAPTNLSLVPKASLRNRTNRNRWKFIKRWETYYDAII